MQHCLRHRLSLSPSLRPRLPLLVGSCNQPFTVFRHCCQLHQSLSTTTTTTPAAAVGVIRSQLQHQSRRTASFIASSASLCSPTAAAAATTGSSSVRHISLQTGTCICLANFSSLSYQCPSTSTAKSLCCHHHLKSSNSLLAYSHLTTAILTARLLTSASQLSMLHYLARPLSTTAAVAAAVSRTCVLTNSIASCTAVVRFHLTTPKAVQCSSSSWPLSNSRLLHSVNINDILSSRALHTSPPRTMPPITTALPVSEDVDTLIASSHVVIFTMNPCKFCTKAKTFLDENNVLYREVEIDPERNGMAIYEQLTKKVNRTSVPQVFINGQHIGGCDDTLAKHEEGTLMPLIRGHNYQYDLVVVGGGSGGLAASKEAAALGKKVALLDFVAPTPQGTTWGLGGTCVNVGCIPKKLMHYASLIGQEIDDAHFFGWQSKDGKPLAEGLKHDWTTLVTNVQNNIKGSNFGYKAQLRNNKVNYINAFGSLVDAHTIKLKHKNGKEETVTSNHFLIATGERPRYPADVENASKYAITSDDLFSLSYNPGKTLVIGASYVALECAGFLKGIGNDVTVMVRSIVLRGFDRQCSELVRSYMENVEKVRFIDTSLPKKIVRLDGDDAPKPGTLAVTYVDINTKVEKTEEFNTVLFAIGREPCTGQLGLENVGVTKDKSGYIPVVSEQTNVPNIFAVGDILQGKPQLTPVAIEAGILLAQRLYKGADVQCDYLNVPTTVFTPLEYGACGYTEEAAIAEFGEEHIDVYHQYFAPTEWRLNYYDRPRKPLNVCYVKVIVTRSLNNNPKEERLLGFHYVGPNAGEVTQFVGIPLKLKATKADLDALIGIHPTSAELFTTLTVTKRSGLDATQQGCCG